MKDRENIPVNCHQCDHSRCYMREIGKNRFRSQYVCSITHNEIPSKLTILIPKWCPKGYKNLYDG